MRSQPGQTPFAKPFLLSGFLFLALLSNAQMITGVWHGKINGQKVELKIIQKGDSLTGTSYYYGSGSDYKRYSIRGYFDEDNTVVWWDDQLIDNNIGSGKKAMLSVADFNCPGGGVMKLDGKSSPKENRNQPKGNVALVKVNSTSFPDEWDFVIDNYTVGTNDPYIIDSVQLIAVAPKPVIEEVVVPVPQKEEPNTITFNPEPVLPEKPATIEEKFVIRKKVFTTEIPLAGDSLELRFFDNVQVDGDSITLFLNEKMIFTHIRLTEKAFVIKLAVNDLLETNELTMVAENLGSIPPNTAYMVAICGGQYYNVNLSSTEETSGMIRLVKPKKNG